MKKYLLLIVFLSVCNAVAWWMVYPVNSPDGGTLSGGIYCVNETRALVESDGSRSAVNGTGALSFNSDSAQATGESEQLPDAADRFSGRFNPETINPSAAVALINNYRTNKIVELMLSSEYQNKPLDQVVMEAIHAGHLGVNESMRPNSDNYTPLHALLTLTTRPDTENIRYLLDSGATFNSQRMLRNMSNKRPELVELMVEYGFDLHQTLPNGGNLFSMALTDGNLLLASHLLDAGVTVPEFFNHAQAEGRNRFLDQLVTNSSRVVDLDEQAQLFEFLLQQGLYSKEEMKQSFTDFYQQRVPAFLR